MPKGSNLAAVPVFDLRDLSRLSILEPISSSRAFNNGWVLGRRAIRGGGEGQCKAHAGEIAGDENKLNDYGNTTLKRVPELD